MAGRPQEYDRQELVDLMEKYVQETAIPIVSEFAYMNNIGREYLYTLPELQYTIKKLILKKESALEKKALNNEINGTVAIFSLKQLGWTDTKNINLKSNDFDITKLTKEELQEQIAKLEQK